MNRSVSWVSLLTLLVSIGLFFGPGVFAQEVETEAPLTLFERTLPQDIATADLQELIIWARSLNLSDRGTRAQVEERILEYYGVARPSTAAAESQQRSTGDAAISVLRIDRARGTDYFTLEEVDEQYLRIVGGVVLSLEKEGALHTIEAEEVTINLATDTLAARGLVEYSVTRTDGTERFRGDEIIFQIDTWEGIFIRGVTERRDDASQEEDEFSVSGERISRSAGEIIVIDNGTITSSQADPPNFHIRAARIWILAPGEWALRDATLYVGRVPLLWFPAFFLPGDRLFFSPAVGTRNREGTYVQTTTYLIGQKPDQNPPLSIMRLGDAPEEQDRVIEGLFLRIPDEAPPADPEDWFLKVMADTYTGLGGYAGVAASMPNTGPFSTLDWRLGFGVSRNIYFENGVYSTYYVDDDGNAQRHWNSGTFLGIGVPFRYESELDTRVNLLGASLTIDFLLLSDPEFRRDFWNRDEGMDWSFLFQSGAADDENTATDAATVSSLAWTAALSWTPTISGLSPWIERISIDTLTANLQWRTRDNEEIPAAIDRPESDGSPEEEFFFPQSMLLPELRFTVQGTLYNYPPNRDRNGASESQPEGEPEEQEDPGIDLLRPPWEDRETATENIRSLFRLPEPIGNVPGLPAPTTAGVTFSYNLRPTLRYDRFTDNDDWVAPDDTSLDWAYSTFQTRNQLGFTLNATVRDNWAQLRSNVDLEQRYQTVDSTEAITEQEQDQLRLDAYRFSGEEGSQSTTLTVYPLIASPPLSDSTVQYSLSSLLFERTFEELREDDTPRYSMSMGSWNDEDVSVHRTQMRIAWDVLSASQSMTGTVDLPPLNGAYSGSITAVTGPLTSSVSGGYREDDDGSWTADNLVQTHTLGFFENQLRASQRIEYNLEESRLQQASTDLTFWPLTATLTGRHTGGYHFEEGRGWVSEPEEDFRWTNLAVGLDGSQTLRFWKRRVDLDLNGSAAIDVDLLRYSSSSLVLDYGFTLGVYRFLNLEFSARSRNDFIYQYFDGPASELGRPRRELIPDLIDSLRLFDVDAKTNSFFKIDRIDISAVHDLQDWELTMTYSGLPQLETDNGQSEYRWRGVFSILLRWRSISELRRNIRIEDGEVEFVD